MTTLILIDAPHFGRRIADRFRDVRVVSPGHGAPSCSTLALVEANPGAHVWIDVTPQYPLYEDVSKAGIGLAARLIGDMGVEPDRVRLCGKPPESYFPEAVRIEMQSSGITYVKRTKALETLEKLFGPAGEREHTRASDMHWALHVLGRKKKYKEYVGKIVAVHRRKVWGSGPDPFVARDEARSKEGCPPVHELTFAHVYDMTPKIVPMRFSLAQFGLAPPTKGPSVDE